MAVDTPHHVTQRGNARRFILNCDSDRLVYRQLLLRYARLHQLSLLGYCLMSNHVHLIVMPRRPDSLAHTLKLTHGQYASYFNTRYQSSGHVWQGRYYSCPLDPPHLWAALRYTEHNPVRAGLVAEAERYPWSSAALHCGLPTAAEVEWEPWSAAWTAAAWREYLDGGAPAEEREAIRRCTHTGRPMGSPEFVAVLEQALHRRLRPEKGGRPRKQAPDTRQQIIPFAGT
ncbi:MAG TPA: transposase [Bryobacteraceae bacterium]|nr:transposase [Bryobacteraceae bacterium]